ncbi:MAG: ATP-dependent DNA helicase RecG [Anaerolineae bacterium]|nr:ATP-dependent DNA helicase RecG [Anaerolineae bacterium]
MPSALETLVKILKLEQETGYNNTAVIGGLESYAANWAREAHQQARRPEHHQLVDELVDHLSQYDTLEDLADRHKSVKYMMDRIMGRVPPPDDLPLFTYEPPAQEPPADQAAPAADTLLEAPEQPEPEEPAVTAAPPPQPETRRVTVPSPTAPSHPPRRSRREDLSPDEIDQRLQTLRFPVTVMPRIGDKMAEKLDRLGIQTIGDLLFNFPRRYDDYTRMCPLSRLRPGEVVTIVAAVRSAVRKQGRTGHPYLLVTLDDGTGTLQVTFFGQLWLQRQFRRDSQVVLSGKVELFRGEPMMTNPEWEMLERENLHTGRIVPVYALTQGLSARTMRRLVRHALDQWGDHMPDYMPTSVLERTDLADLGWALRQIHYPDSHEYLAHARTRLTFDELFLFQMGVMGNRRDWQSVSGLPVQVSDEWLDQFLATLPYALTNAQQRALRDIRADMARDIPMNRLLQGDVGSGKTVVAAAALAMTVQAGKQAALMAPTGILADQHARSVGDLLRQSPGGDTIQVRLLTGNTSDAERQAIVTGLADGSINVIIGTHALIQETVTFHDLALAIVDEQHRFGVEQRGALRGKGVNPHLLVMTATPIPRTLALTLYADLDLSIIDEMPPGRMPVETRVLRAVERERAYSFVRSQIDKEHQAFIVYPLVESSEKMEDLGAAVEEYDRLKDRIFPNYRVGLLHGRMKPAEKDAIMNEFAAGEIDILVSTSVVEVGIDVPNASVILIENADRFGLAQLHQFRGRVGRGEHKSFCLLVAESASDIAAQRLQAMEDTTDGFKLAEIDWKLRGPGDLLGVRQSGISTFHLAEMITPQLVELAQREVRTVYAEDPYLQLPEHHLLATQIQAMLDRRADIS